MRAVLYVEFRGEPEKLEKIREEIDRNDRCCLSANDVVGDTLVIEGETKGYIPVLIGELAEKYGCIYGFEHEWISENMCETYDPHGILPGYWRNDCLMDQRDWHMCETGVAMSWDEALAEVNARGGEYTMEDIQNEGGFEAWDVDEEGNDVYITLIPNRRLKEEEIRWETREMASIDYMKCRVCGRRVCYRGRSGDIWNTDGNGEDRDVPPIPMALCPECEQSTNW